VSTDLFGAVSRCAAFSPGSSTSVGVLGLGIWLPFCRLRLFLLSTPLCLCWLWLAWLGVAPGMATLVGEILAVTNILAGQSPRPASI
jgi:hypothetical protein